MFPEILIGSYAIDSYTAFNYFLPVLLCPLIVVLCYRWAGIPTLRSLCLAVFYGFGYWFFSKLGYVLLYWPGYADFDMIFSASGIMIVGVLAILSIAPFVLNEFHYEPLKILDYTVPAVAVIIICSKIGCFGTGCCAGVPTALPWGVMFPGREFAVHPTQLYEAAFGLAAAICSFVKLRQPEAQRTTGAVFLGFLLSFSVFRAIMFWIRNTPGGANYIEYGPFAFGLLVILAVSAYCINEVYQKTRGRELKCEERFES